MRQRHHVRFGLAVAAQLDLIRSTGIVQVGSAPSRSNSGHCARRISPVRTKVSASSLGALLFVRVDASRHQPAGIVSGSVKDGTAGAAALRPGSRSCSGTRHTVGLVGRENLIGT